MSSLKGSPAAQAVKYSSCHGGRKIAATTRGNSAARVSTPQRYRSLAVRGTCPVSSQAPSRVKAPRIMARRNASALEVWMRRLLSVLVLASTPLVAGQQPLTIERIFSDPPLDGTLPKEVRWLPDG